MSSLSGDEGSEIIENEPVRRTRSGRTLKTNAAVTPKRTPAKKAPARLTRSTRNVQETEQPPAPVETETNTSENGVQQEVTKDEQDSNSAKFDSNESEEQFVEQNQEQVLETQEEENNEHEQGEGQIDQGEENSQQECIVQQEEYEMEQEQTDENQLEENFDQQEFENLNQQEQDYQNEEAQNFDQDQQDQDYNNQEAQDIQNQPDLNDENQEEPDSESLDQSLQTQEQDIQNQEEQENDEEQANELQETQESTVPMESEELVEFEPAQEEIPTEAQEEIPTAEPMAVDEVSHSTESTLRVKDTSEMMEESIDDQCILIEDDVDQFGLEEELLESTKKDSGTVEKNYSAQDSEIIPDNDQFRNEDVEFILDGNDVSENFSQQVNQDDSHEVIEISDHESEPPSKKNEIDTEAVSEDELPTEAAAKEPETEAVSDEELPVTQPADLGETESVSDDELPIESEKKRKSSKSSKSSEKKAKSETSNKRKRNAEGEYDPSSPTSENNDETPAKKVAVSADATSDKTDAKPPSPKKKTLPELEKYWKAVNDDPSDFTGWTYLLQYVDQENDAEAAREAYDKFLERYPYCYGYWRKYADYEKKKGKPERVQTVFDQGLKSISLSVDLWLHYINHCKVVHEKNEEKMREQYERAIKACGLEFRSDRLWESYIKWESENKRLNKVMGIYDRLLSTPTLGYMSHFETFQDFVTTNSPNRILNVDDFLALRAEVKASLKADDGTTDADDTPPGEDSSKDTPPTDEETRAIREKIISTRRKMHKMNVNAVAARWTFEEGIKRPYFHVKPLERCQLKNWKEYLDYEIEQKDQSRIIILFERCLIACALYDEFWMRYVRYLESLKEDNTEAIRDVYTRACMVHHPKKPNLHLLWATFEESMGNFDKAASILENIDKATPNMLQIAYRRINLERRRGDLEKSCTLYEHYINNSKNRTIANNIVVKYARFLCKIKNDTDKAVKVLLKATEKDKDNPRLYLQLIDLGLQRNPIDTQEVVKYMDLFIDREHADLEQRVLFAQRKVEFLEDFSTDIRQVLKAHEQFQQCIKQAKERKKTKNEESKAESAKKAKADASNIPPPAAQSYQYGSTTPYQSQAQFQGGQYSSQGGYQQGYQQYPPPSDPNYANYQNWQYGQSGPQAYAPYNQWGSYNYY